ncbi:bacillithiol biosynthesis protein BshC [Bacillus sp. HC-Mk]
MISKYKEIQEGLRNQQEVIKELGYKPIIETKSHAVHIFMEIDNERVLLEDQQGKFVGKDGAHSFSYEELIEEMERNPARVTTLLLKRAGFLSISSINSSYEKECAPSFPTNLPC